MQEQTQATLSSEEWDLVRCLREIPAGRVRERVTRTLDDVLGLMRSPHCAEQQADGAPCAQTDGRCEECQRMESFLSALVARLRSAAHEA